MVFFECTNLNFMGVIWANNFYGNVLVCRQDSVLTKWTETPAWKNRQPNPQNRNTIYQIYPKLFLNNYKTTLKKSRKRLFWPKNWLKMTPQNGQSGHIFDRKSWCSGSFINLSSCEYTRNKALKALNNAQILLKQVPNNFEKSQNLTKKYAPPRPTK